MIRRWLSLLLCLHVCLGPANVSAATAQTRTRPAAAVSARPATLRVDEATTRVSLEEGRIKVSLVVSNATRRELGASVALELLDTNDSVVARDERFVLLRAGVNSVPAHLPLSASRPRGDERHALLWHRLRYRVAPRVTPLSESAAATPAGRDAAPRTAEGVVSLSEITPDLFELRVAAPRRASEGQSYRVRARTVHPVSARPVGGARVTAVLGFDDDGKTPSLTSAATTNSDGYAAIDFQLPARVTDKEVDVKVTARLGGFEQTASGDFEFDRSIQYLVTTDKPLYQPGQTLHVRALLLDPARRAVPGIEVEVDIADEEGTTVFRAPLKTSRFGVASADWPIPEGARLGDYRIRFETDDPRYADDDTEGLARVRVSRYELPNFAAQVKPDRDYYLPGESAAVEVRADYLFGQQVKRGRVRVVRESERVWNYTEQRYDVKEGAKYEGDFDAAGRFVARVALADEHRELAENTWARFEDASFAAYVTDPTTNRTEQRRFSLRVTRDPVHIYVTEGNYRQAEGLPLAFYVSTYYPDGTPAECEVKISERISESAPHAGEAARPTDGARPPRTVKTNRYGVAKVVGPLLARGESPRPVVSLGFEARDRAGRGGRFEEEFSLERDDPVIRVETDKAIYAPGEPVEVEISSDRPDMRLHFDVAVEGRVLRGDTVRLHGGRARLSVPYQTAFQNRVTFAAYTTELPKNSWDEYAKGARAVIFPRDRELKFNLRFGRATYAPGEEASADVHVRTAAGRGIESALGVVVFDKAVEERARTDSEFNSAYGFSDGFYSFWYGPEAIGGVSLRALEKLDPRQSRPEGFDTVAELLLQRGYYDDDSPNVFGSGDGNDAGPETLFAGLATAQLKPALDSLAAHYAKTGAYPFDDAKLRQLLLTVADIDFGAVRDPWGTPYRAEFAVERQLDVLTFVSAGADKKFDTGDDWRAGRSEWPYFRPLGERMSGAVEAHHRRTGGHLRDVSTLKAEMRAGGLDFDALRDRRGRPYDLRFEIAGANYIFRVVSAGPDGRLSQPAEFHGSDDFFVWSLPVDYFAETRARADAALAAHYQAGGGLPRDEMALRDLLNAAGVTLEQLRDPWGRDYYATFHDVSNYSDLTEYIARESGDRIRVTPVTQQLAKITLRSGGADGARGTGDDFQVAEFAAVVTRQSAGDKEPRAVAPVTTFSGATGAITGTVFDPNGAVIITAVVKAAHSQPGQTFEVKTDEEGRFTLRNLPPGLYDLRVEAPGFKHAVVAGVRVRAASLAQVDLTLEVGASSETVTVMGSGGGSMETTSSQISGLKRGGVSSPRRQPVTTPRLRKDFPETLYWQPELVTDKSGRAQLKFKLADNITTWKVSVIGSTETGELGTAEREIRAFQPFFVEHDPPRVLTEGDEISLPVTLRNYLDRPQRVALGLKPEDWFTSLGPATKTSDVPAGDAARETFDLRATASVNEGRQRITAVAADAADAVEKPVHVHPDGEEIAETSTQLFDARAALEVNVPAHVIPRSARAELKIYPNLMAHAVESIEAVMSRPYGCGEQTISSAYPSLLVLRHYARTRGNDDSQLPGVAVTARRHVRLGYERLLTYRAAEGGFTYWGAGAPDLALTAYAVRFLDDASEFVEVDHGVLDGARRWLVSRQQPDGSWPSSDRDGKLDSRRTALLTAYVARVIAGRAAREHAAPPKTRGQAAAAKPDDDDRAALARALKYLAARSAEIDEPYLIASYLLAAIDGGDAPADIERAAARLRSLARDEAGGTYWSLETNTPFHGWGLAGRIETTALAVQALSSYCGLRIADCGLEDKGSITSQAPTPGSDNPQSAIRNPQSGESAIRNPQLISRGLLFLLRNKDRYGVWLSTQATVNVLDALLLLSRQSEAHGAQSMPVAPTPASQTPPRPVADDESAQVFVNGQLAGTIMLPPGERADAPVSLDLSRFIAAGANRVEVRRPGGRPAAAAQLVTTYYVPWPQSGADARNASPRSSRALRLKVDYERTRAEVGEEIVCRVVAERIGHEGYGMLLAEVGLPPGAEVNRESLRRAMSESGWELSRYDVLPDRLVAYLWPRAGGTRFSFTFRARLGLRAKTAPSQVYDYYNPEARAVVAPASFVITDNAKARPAQAKKE